MSVYFCQRGENGPIKIGYARDPLRRLAQLQVANAETLVLLLTLGGARGEELVLHKQFARDRFHPRREWFRPSEALLVHIEHLRNQLQETRERKTADPVRGKRMLGDLIRWQAQQLGEEATEETVLRVLNYIETRPPAFYDAIVAFRHLTQENRRRQIRRALNP